MRRAGRQDVVTAATIPDCRGAARRIRGSRALVEARRRGESNTSRAGGRPAAGRALLLAIVLVFLAGILWLRFGSGARPPSPSSGTEPRQAPRPAAPDEVARDEETELVPAAPPSALDPAPGHDGELEPFASARSAPVPVTGKRGSLRGHAEVSGEEPFPRQWRLVLRPSNTLAGREHATTMTLEFDDGRQDFTVPDVPLGGYDVLGEAEGFNGQVLPVALVPGSEQPFINLLMVPAGTLEGRILDGHGLPAEGVTVTLFAVADNAAREEATDAQGVFRFEKLPDGGYDLLVGRASAPLMPERHPVRFLAPHLTFPDLELPLLGEIQVRVVDSLARPLEGVEVRGSGTNGGIVEGRTDYDGRLVTRHLPAGHFRLRLTHPALGEQYTRRVAVDVVAGQVAEAPVRLGP